MHWWLPQWVGLVSILIVLPAWSSDLVHRGEYVFRAAGCASCHTDRDNKGPFLAGGRALDTRFGTFYSPNITPDPEHGIGRWSDEDFLRALTEGISPQGTHYYPAFPYTSYTHMRRDDVLALKAYLFTVTPVARENQAHALPWYARIRSLMWLWKLLYFQPGEFDPDPDRSPSWNRGAYLATAMANCGGCHTPRNLLGALKESLQYAGTEDGLDGKSIPNITPDRKTGIGRWSKNDLTYLLQSGGTPDGDFVGGSMAEVVDDGLRYLTAADIDALVTYVFSVRPIENAVRRKKEVKAREFEY